MALAERHKWCISKMLEAFAPELTPEVWNNLWYLLGHIIHLLSQIIHSIIRRYSSSLDKMLTCRNSTLSSREKDQEECSCSTNQKYLKARCVSIVCLQNFNFLPIVWLPLPYLALKCAPRSPHFSLLASHHRTGPPRALRQSFSLCPMVTRVIWPKNAVTSFGMCLWEWHWMSWRVERRWEWSTLCTPYTLYALYTQ